MTKPVGLPITRTSWQWQPGSTHDPRPPLELENPPVADTFVPRGLAALVVGAIIAGSWVGPQLTALDIGSVITAEPAAEVPFVPKPRDRQVEAAATWNVTWDAQRRPFVAGIIPAAVADPFVPKRRDQQVERAAGWNATWDAQKRAPVAGVYQAGTVPPPLRRTSTTGYWPVGWDAPPARARAPIEQAATPDNPPPRLRTLPPGLESWYPAQLAILKLSVATETGPAPAGDNPPWRSRGLPPGFESWYPPQLSILKLSTATESGAAPPAGDNPPPVRRDWLWSVIAANLQPDLRPYSSSVYAHAQIDNPPPRRLQPEAIGKSWERTWPAQRSPTGLGWLQSTPPAADNPPPRRLTPDVSSWERTWPAQRATTGLAWGFVAATDNPPPRRAVPDVSSWQRSWDAQRAHTFPWTVAAATPDNPPFRRQEIQAAILSWQHPAYSVIKLGVVNESGAAPPDNPPPISRGWLWTVLRSNEQPSLSSYASSVYAHARIDLPPPKVQQQAAIWDSWRVSWPVARSTTGLPWLYVAPTPDNPPPKRRDSLAAIVQSWQLAAVWTVPPRPPVVTPSGPEIEPPVVVEQPPFYGRHHDDPNFDLERRVREWHRLEDEQRAEAERKRLAEAKAAAAKLKSVKTPETAVPPAPPAPVERVLERPAKPIPPAPAPEPQEIAGSIEIMPDGTVIVDPALNLTEQEILAFLMLQDDDEE